jgi:hypothetical protein
MISTSRLLPNRRACYVPGERGRLQGHLCDEDTAGVLTPSAGRRWVLIGGGFLRTGEAMSGVIAKQMVQVCSSAH